MAPGGSGETGAAPSWKTAGWPGERHSRTTYESGRCWAFDGRVMACSHWLNVL